RDARGFVQRAGQRAQPALTSIRRGRARSLFGGVSSSTPSFIEALIRCASIFSFKSSGRRVQQGERPRSDVVLVLVVIDLDLTALMMRFDQFQSSGVVPESPDRHRQSAGTATFGRSNFG